MTNLSLENVTIHQFRGLRDLELKDLGRINLLVGVNNSGKTSVLEALSVYCHPLDIKAWLSTARQREQDLRFSKTSSLDSLQWLFSKDVLLDKDQSKAGTILISGDGAFNLRKMKATYKEIEGVFIPRKRGQITNLDENFEEDASINEDEDYSEVRKGFELNVELCTDDLHSNVNESYQIWENELGSVGRSEPSLKTTTVTPTSHRSNSIQIRLLSDAQFSNFKSDVVQLLRQMDQNISDLEILASPGSSGLRLSQFSPYIKHKKLGLAPVSTFGDGVRRLLHIALKLASCKGGVLFIDEIEATIHTEALQNSFIWLVKWCEQMDVQLFATTHSLEAVDALLGSTELASDLVLYRLEPKDMQTRVIRHGWNRLKRLREELGQEVRW
jgi:predicted ATP-dependent endonuclease of OLD family